MDSYSKETTNNTHRLLPSPYPIPARRHHSSYSSCTAELWVSCYHDKRDTTVATLAAPAFSVFSKFPRELRDTIWRMALPPPRLVTVAPRLDMESSVWEVQVETQEVGLLYVCRESRTEALKHYDQIKFSDDKGTYTHVNWSLDTVFLDVYDECLDVDMAIGLLGAGFRAVQSLAIRLRNYVLWDFQLFLRRFDRLQKLIFVDEPHRARLGRNISILLILTDLGQGRDFRWRIEKPSEEDRDLDNVLMTLMECYGNQQFDIRRWEMPFEGIEMIRNLTDTSRDHTA